MENKITKKMVKDMVYEMNHFGNCYMGRSDGDAPAKMKALEKYLKKQYMKPEYYRVPEGDYDDIYFTGIIK